MDKEQEEILAETDRKFGTSDKAPDPNKNEGKKENK